uniref:Zinc metalloproteinase n=1 Tax=Parastrongyloides trichosuri TaxID=131310 RepID=A0A0N4Z7N5_PARTI
MIFYIKIFIFAFLSYNLIHCNNYYDTNEKNQEREKRAISNTLRYNWTMPIQYYVDPSVNDTAVEIALNGIQNNTCIRFNELPKPPNGTGLIYFSGSGCNSYVGRLYNKNNQTVSIGFGCSWNGVIQHETGHALGLYHEQSRPDRNSYISINTTNALSGTENNFLQYNDSLTLGVPYDYGSAMHYGHDAFSKNKLDTITPLNPLFEHVIGQYAELSFNDFKLLNLFYCSNTCSTKLTNCLNGGYQDPNNCTTCKCPNGYGGVTCNVVASSDNGCSTSNLIATSTVQTLTDSGIKNCYYRITTTSGSKIKMTLQSTNVYYYDPCWVGVGLEIKFSQDKSTTGALFCGKINQTTIITQNNEGMINYIGWDNSHNFKLSYQKV